MQEFNIEKLHLLEAEKSKIRKDFERRESQIEVKKKIEFSKQLNASRIKVGRRSPLQSYTQSTATFAARILRKVY